MRSEIIKIFIGFDQTESVAWHTLVSSIMRQSSMPLAIVPINLGNLKKIFKRERDPKQSNDFSFTRFLVPYLCDFKGYGIFLDCDMLLRCDIAEIFNVVQEQPSKAVYVVKHDYTPREEIKFHNSVQYKYPRKNWSSVVLWDAGHISNKQLTPEIVNTASGLYLHRFNWLEDDQIGDLDIKWNWLIGEYEEPPADVKNVHWTVGGPYFNEYSTVDYSEEWFLENQKMNNCTQREAK
jgi:hypothetical protein